MIFLRVTNLFTWDDFSFGLPCHKHRAAPAAVEKLDLGLPEAWALTVVEIATLMAALPKISQSINP